MKQMNCFLQWIVQKFFFKFVCDNGILDERRNSIDFDYSPSEFAGKRQNEYRPECITAPSFENSCIE